MKERGLNVLTVQTYAGDQHSAQQHAVWMYMFSAPLHSPDSNISEQRNNVDYSMPLVLKTNQLKLSNTMIKHYVIYAYVAKVFMCVCACTCVCVCLSICLCLPIRGYVCFCLCVWVYVC